MLKAKKTKEVSTPEVKDISKKGKDIDISKMKDAEPKRGQRDKKDFVRAAGKNIAKTFVNKRDAVRLEPGRPEKIMSEHKKAAAELINSKTQNQPMKVTVTGIEPFKNGKSFVMMPVALYHGWKIIIPRDQFVTEDMVKGPGTVEEEIVKRINGSVGSEVKIIPFKFLPEQKIVVASRLKAMAEEVKEMWYATNVKKNSKDYLLTEGSIAQARIVFVVKGGVTVEVHGVESFIPVSDVSYVRIDNCRGKYKAGDETMVKITDVERNGDNVSFTANIKGAYRDPREELFTLHVVGGMYNGRVTMIETNPERDSSAYVLLDSGIEVKCNYPKKVLLDIGDRVSVAIRRKDPVTLRFWGDIVHVDRQDD